MKPANGKVEIHFGELRPSMQIVNPVRRQIGNAFFEAGSRITILGRSSEKDANGKPFMVIISDRRVQYASEDDVAIDISMFPKLERAKLTAEELRQKLKEILFKGNGHC